MAVGSYFEAVFNGQTAATVGYTPTLNIGGTDFVGGCFGSARAFYVTFKYNGVISSTVLSCYQNGFDSAANFFPERQYGTAITISLSSTVVLTLKGQNASGTPANNAFI